MIENYAATQQERQDAIAAAHDRGDIVRYGTAGLLTVDLDYPEGSPQYEKALWRIGRFGHAMGGVERVEVCRSKSGNVHLYIHLKQPMQLLDRPFWAAAIGSDGTREMLNFIYAMAHGEDRALLFDPAGSELRAVA